MKDIFRRLGKIDQIKNLVMVEIIPAILPKNYEDFKK